jgi:hypothetical protein
MSAEREAFEAWYMEHMGKAVGVYERTHVKEYRDGDGYADRPVLDGCWVGWCAATSAHSARIKALEDALRRYVDLDVAADGLKGTALCKTNLHLVASEALKEQQ